MFEHRDAEKTIFQDPVTGREIWRLTNGPLDDRHTYFDVFPWSPDGRHIVFSSARPEDTTVPLGDLLTTQHGQIYLMDTETFAFEKLADGAFFDTHTGSFTAWHPTGQGVFFRYSPREIGYVDIDTKEVSRFPGQMRQISPDGTTFVYTVTPPAPMAERGVYLMDIDGSNARRVITTKEIYDLTPNRDQFTLDDIRTGNTKWSPDGEHILLTIWIKLDLQARKYSEKGIRRSLYICDKDGGNLRWLSYTGHHHSWLPDGSGVMFCEWLDPIAQTGPRVYLVDFDGCNRRLLIDDDLGGHPGMDPTMKRVATWDEKGVIVVDVDAQKLGYVAIFGPSGFDMSHEGCHPHPIWSADGSQLLYNDAQFGRSQLCLMPF